MHGHAVRRGPTLQTPLISSIMSEVWAEMVDASPLSVTLAGTVSTCVGPHPWFSAPKRELLASTQARCDSSMSECLRSPLYQQSTRPRP